MWFSYIVFQIECQRILLMPEYCVDMMCCCLYNVFCKFPKRVTQTRYVTRKNSTIMIWPEAYPQPSSWPPRIPSSVTVVPSSPRVCSIILCLGEHSHQPTYITSCCESVRNAISAKGAVRLMIVFPMFILI